MTASELSPATVEQALADLRVSFESDGYGLIVRNVQSGAVHVEIIATAGACAECLVPVDVTREMIAAALDISADGVEVQYPNAHQPGARPAV